MTTDAPKRAKPHTRYYLQDGSEVPGVTTLLGILAKPALIPWANRIGLEGFKVNEYVDEAARAGTLAHAIIAHELGGPEPDYSEYTPNQREKAENAALSYFEWAKGREMETVVAETPLVSEFDRFGGTPDWYGVMGGKRVLLDIKTSKAIYDDHLYQLGGYCLLLEGNDHPVDEARILQVGRTEDEGFSERILPRAAMEGYIEVFLAARNAYNAIRAAKKGSRS